MNAIEVIAPTGDARVDPTLRDVIRRYEAALPGRVRGYYLHGSFADGTAVASSDIDLLIVFAGELDTALRAAAVR